MIAPFSAWKQFVSQSQTHHNCWKSFWKIPKTAKIFFCSFQSFSDYRLTFCFQITEDTKNVPESS